MEINIKIDVEQPAPPGVLRQRSDERDEQTDRQTDRLDVFRHPAAGEIGAPPNLAW